LINQEIVRLTQNFAEEIRGMQTGLLNWNIMSIVATLIAVLLLVSLGA